MGSGIYWFEDHGEASPHVDTSSPAGIFGGIETTLAGNSWTGTAAQGSDGVPIPGSVQKCGSDTWGHALVVAMADGQTQ